MWNNEDSTTQPFGGIVRGMRAIVRYIITGIWLLLLVIVGTIFRQNIEEFAAEKGWDNILSQWWSGAISLSYSGLALVLFIALTGSVATLWVDSWIRGYLAKRRAADVRRLTFRLNPQTGHYKSELETGIDGFTVLVDKRNWNEDKWESDPKVSDQIYVVTLIYDHLVENSEILVNCSSEVIYKVFCNSNRFAYIDLDFKGTEDEVWVEIFVYSPERFFNVHSWEQHWHDAGKLNQDEVAALKQRLDTAKEKQP